MTNNEEKNKDFGEDNFPLCELECGAYGSICKCRVDALQALEIASDE